MNLKFVSVLVVALVTWLAAPLSADAQRITSLLASAKGQGTLTVANAEKRKINAVVVNLKENGVAEITILTDLQLTASGKWTADDDSSKGIALKITGGIVTGNAAGEGTLFLRSDGKSIDKLYIQAKSGTAGEVTVEFVAEKKIESAATH